MTISKVSLGKTGPQVFPIALGCMGMSGVYGDTDERQSIATIHAALERGVDLIEVGVETTRRAQAVPPICDLQIEYSLVSRGPEEKIFPALAELGIAVTAYGVLSRGLLTGARPSAAGDYRAHLPRFAPENQA